MTKTEKGVAVCRLPGADSFFGKFTNPIKQVSARTMDEILPSLKKIEELTNSGFYAVGYLSYEAATAFDPAFKVSQESKLPLLNFFIYDTPPENFSTTNFPLDLKDIVTPELSKNCYLSDLKQVLDYIYEGDIYQANYTFRADLPIISDPYKLFNHLVSAHPVPYSAFLDFGDYSTVSISPELFLEKNGSHLISKPMKGTAPRTMNYDEDCQQKVFLANDPKNRAENLMIVDMVRNDFGRICNAGSIKVDPLFQVDTYPTVHQMISTVHGETTATLTDIFTALFPAASITGAPKIRAMEIIQELEKSPREVYCGAVGCIVPGGDFCFNVPIRTLLCENDQTRLGIGSGVVADSKPESEWAESLLKSHFVFNDEPEFELFETLAWLPESGYTDLEKHLERMRKSQLWFLRPFPENPHQFLADKFDGPQRIKIIISKTGKIRTEHNPLKTSNWGSSPKILKISEKTINSKNRFLYHKTTKRELYTEELLLAKNENFDEVIFFNENGHLTEGSISNIFVKIDKEWYTPSLDCGLLPGIERAKLIKEFSAKESKITNKQLKSATEIIICNSLRGKVEAKL